MTEDRTVQSGWAMGTLWRLDSTQLDMTQMSRTVTHQLSRVAS